MKPRQERLTLAPEHSFVLQKDVYPYYPTPWHYHPEYELVLVLKSSGYRTVGNHKARFTDGDLVFMGPNLPHAYQNDPVYYEPGSQLKAEAIVIHFGEDFLGKDFFSIPEMIHVKELFQRSVVGTQVLGNTRKEIADMMVAMLSLSGPARIIKLLVILEILSSSKELVNLASPGYLQQAVYPGNDRLSKVYEHIMANFSDNITLKEAANMANMSVPSFSRFFKSCTRKGFSHFLNEIRVGYACKLLVEERFNISQICYLSGFNNMSNFNRQFKKITGKSPVQYKHRDIAVPEPVS